MPYQDSRQGEQDAAMKRIIGTAACTCCINPGHPLIIQHESDIKLAPSASGYVIGDEGIRI